MKEFSDILIDVKLSGIPSNSVLVLSTRNESERYETEFIILGTKAMLRGVPDVTIKFCNNSVHASKQARNLGVLFDQSLSFQPHIDQMVQK